MPIVTERVEAWLARYESGQIDRRAFLAGVTGLLGSAATGDAQPSRGVVVPSGIHHVEIKTLDVARSTAFYTKLFGPGQTASDRTVIALGSGVGRGYLTIARGPIPRVDHLALKVPGMHPKDPSATAKRLAAEGYQVRQVGAALYVMDPDKFEVEVLAPASTL